MKKLNIFGMLLLMLTFFTGCKEESITLTSELPQFETREGYMLLEVIVPYGTGINDQIYIYGDFNGGEDAIGNPQWLLQRGNPQSGVPAKFGIYLNPNDFVSGKTLADGYQFYNIQNGPELNVDQEPVVHYAYPQPGQRLNVFVDYWEEDFNEPENPEDVTHDGYAVYVINNTSWTELALYAWGDAEAFGGWPGITPTGRMAINGVNYTYFDTGASNEGLNLNLIFNNNNNGSQLPDVNVTLNRDFYFELTDSGAVEIDPNASTPHDGYAIFVYNADAWDLHIWVWEEGAGGEDFLGVGWPGAAFTGTQTINGVAYDYYDFGEGNSGKTVNIIVNNNGSPQTDTMSGVVLDKNYYYELTGGKLIEIDPDDFKPGDAPNEPSDPDQPQPEPDTNYNIYIQNNTGWSSFFVYSWGSSEILGGWPGSSSDVTTTVGGEEYLVFEVPGTNETENFIFNDNAGTQYDAAALMLNKDYYIMAGPDSAEVLDNPTINIYVDNQTSWTSIALYSWGSGEIFGGWPGAVPAETVTIDGVTYDVYSTTATGQNENLIFNNNGGGDQLGDFTVRLSEDCYLIVTDEGVKFANE